MPKQGFFTASTFPDLMQNDRSGKGFGKAALGHIERFALDTLGFHSSDEVGAASLEWGLENESNARFFYEQKTMCEVRRAEFAVSPTLDFVGGTGDGLVGASGGIEIKCPSNSAIHMLRVAEHFKAYEWQIHGYIWIYQLAWQDFVSYDPRAPEHLMLRIMRVKRDAEKIAALESRCILAREAALRMCDDAQKQDGVIYA